MTDISNYLQPKRKEKAFGLVHMTLTHLDRNT